ncbi:MAG: flippase-like domain-containing protein [Chitinophagaceae bacterium]|nr:flippase-like domain-containing protein [Chitinophagaceae bacterium]
MFKNKSIKIIFKATVGLILFLWLVYTIYHQIKRQPDLKNTLQTMYSSWDMYKLGMLCLVFILMFLNWTVEAKKWQQLMLNTERISLGKSLQSILTGVAVSVITPNRIGEYMGRILYLRNPNKIQGITVTIVGSFAQLIITGFAGVIGLVYYLVVVKQLLWLYFLLGASLLLLLGLSYLYFHLQRFYKLVERFSYFRKLKVYIEVVQRFGRTQLIRILLLSLLRYFVYTVQLVLLMKLFLVNINILSLVHVIWLIFWAMAIVPTIAVVEVGVRGETAVYFLAPLSTNYVGILSATSVLWLINLIIPALIGCLFVYKMKLYDDDQD